MRRPMTKNQLILRSLVGVLIILPLYILYISSFSWLLLSHGKKCDLFEGNWVRDLNHKPYYTNATCGEINYKQNCMKNGRPDTEFLQWRWKPKKCELPPFDAEQFLELVRGKSMAFIGDSLARNQFQSLLCLLGNVVKPANVVADRTADPLRTRWVYLNYNFTLEFIWSPFLVKATNDEPSPGNHDADVYLDVPGDIWAGQIEGFDYLLFSTGRWFFTKPVFYENGRVVGCYHCGRNGTRELTADYGYRKVFRTVLKTLEGFKGVTFLKTLSPSHYDNGDWTKGGTCNWTQPVSEGQWVGDDLEVYRAQVEEFRRAKLEGNKKFKLLDIGELMLMRPDGHPNYYWPNAQYAADCTHWCLPGPVDTWNEFLLQMLKMERQS